MLKQILIKRLPHKYIRALATTREFLEYLSAIVACSLKLNILKPYLLKYGLSEPKKIKLTTVHERWGSAFQYYRAHRGKPVPLVWCGGPSPGNFGDWLSPYVIHRISGRPVDYLPAFKAKSKHLVGLGSIVSRANSYSVLLGTGAASEKEIVEKPGAVISLRGPVTAATASAKGWGECHDYGDIGFLIGRCYHAKPSLGRDILLAPHINHDHLYSPMNSPWNVVSLKVSHPADIESLIDKIVAARIVVTSAMHCLIVCIAYSIPCVLFQISKPTASVPGTGIKYRDALLGADLPAIDPLYLDNPEDIFQTALSKHIYAAKISEASLDRMENSVHTALATLER